ncbi:MAG TPA: hypothetical protein VGN23_12375 [Verrucomicrobiae bacterium]
MGDHHSIRAIIIKQANRAAFEMDPIRRNKFDDAVVDVAGQVDLMAAMGRGSSTVGLDINLLFRFSPLAGRVLVVQTGGQFGVLVLLGDDLAVVPLTYSVRSQMRELASLVTMEYPVEGGR